MPTLKQLRSSIRGQITGQVPSDETRFRDGFIDYQIRSVRSELIKDYARRGVGVPHAFYQRLCCLEVLCDTITCGTVPLPFKAHYLSVPSLENVPHNPSYIGTPDGSRQFSRVPFTSLHQYKGGSFGNGGAYALVEDMAILKLPSDMLETKKLCLYGILEDPYKNMCIVDKENEEYPIPSNLVHKLEIMVLKQVLATLPIPPDTDNTSRDDQPEKAGTSRVRPPQ